MGKLWSLRGLSWRDFIKCTLRKSWDDDIFGQSARMALYFFFAFFPVLLLLLVFLTKTVGATSGWHEALLDFFRQVLPSDAAGLLTQTVQQLNARAVLGTGAVVATMYAGWGALNGTWAMMTGLNKAYEVEEERRWWRLFLIMSGLTISVGVLSLIALAVLVYGNRISNLAARHVVQWAVIAILLFLSLALLYRFGPNLKNRRWQWSFPGAVVGVLLWLPLTLLLRAYQEHFSSSRIYGGLNAVATFLMWLYATGAAIFVGGEANSEIEKAAAKSDHPDGRPGGEGRSGRSGTPDS